MAVATKRRLDPNQVYVCHVAYLSGPMQAAALEGQELLGSDERILALGDHWDRYWAPLGASEDSWPSPFDRVVQENDANSRTLEEERQAAFERAAKANPVKIAAAPMLRAKKDIIGHLDGQPATVKKGSELPADHPFVLDHPGDFS